MARLTRKGNPAIVTSQKPDQPSEIVDAKADKRKIVDILEGYRIEAEYARLNGSNSRDAVWLQHWDLYWNRYDFSKKAAWQSRELLPEFPQYVDRFAAAMRMALVAVERFFTITADGDDDGDLANVIRKLMIAVLRRIGRSPSGHPVDFMTVFEDAMKMGALSMCSAIVTWKENGDGGGYTAIDLEDPYNVWLDPTGRSLYRIRRVEMDLHEFLALSDARDGDGMALYDRSEVMDCYASTMALMMAERMRRTGTGQWSMSNRRPVVLHEYYCTLLDNEGEVLGTNVLCVVANNRYLIRGPEENPFWHGHDWLVTAPIITVPLAPYGKTYAENFATIARTFNELTNLILDAIQTSALKAFVATPENFEDPSQIEEGIYPNVVIRAAPGIQHQEILSALDMGQLPPEVFQLWQALKKELQEGAAFNEMTLGQAAPNSRTSATEINTVDSNATSYIKSIASNIEHLWLEPLLDLIWKVTIQHLNKGDTDLSNAVGDQWFQTLLKQKKEFAEYKVRFVCRGITGLLEKRQKFQQLMQFLQVIGANPVLAQYAVQEFTPQKLYAYVADLMDVELDRLKPSPREQLMQQLQGQGQQQQQLQQQMALKGAGKPAAAPAQPSFDPQEKMMDAQMKAHEIQLKEGSAIRTHQAKRAIDLQYEMAKPKPPPRPAQRGGPLQV